MSRKRQKNQDQMELAFLAEPEGEAPRAEQEGTELPMAKRDTESPARRYDLLEEILNRDNLKDALKRVKANQGSPGVDGMSVVGLSEHLKEHWPALREQLQRGTYRPQPVKRIEEELATPESSGALHFSGETLELTSGQYLLIDH